MTIRALVWSEYFHERVNKNVAALYPDGLHAAVAEALMADGDIVAGTAVLEDAEHGLSEAALDQTDVLLWWGHARHAQVADDIVERVAMRVWSGMGLIVLHSGHFSKIFRRLMGTPCALKWREAGERERIWVVNPRHPIAAGLPEHFELQQEEMYSEPFSVPEPLETVFVSWFQGGEVFRSGLTWRRGAGNIFYFRPGHEAYPTYHNENVGKVLRNAVRWAHNPQPRIEKPADAPEVPVDTAPEKIEAHGPSVH